MGQSRLNRLTGVSHRIEALFRWPHVVGGLKPVNEAATPYRDLPRLAAGTASTTVDDNDVRRVFWKQPHPSRQIQRHIGTRALSTWLA